MKYLWIPAKLVRWSSFVCVPFLASAGWSMAPQASVDGQWNDVYDMFNISCADCNEDEIGHVTLLPNGNVLVWTKCDHVYRDTACSPYRTHILAPPEDPFDPFNPLKDPPQVDSSPSLDSALPDYGTPGNPERRDGPFCSGHTWMLDNNSAPKFLVVGGTYSDFDITGVYPASNETLWFDPITEEWADGPGTLPDLDSGDPGETIAPARGSWYPSVLTFHDDNNTPATPGDDYFRPITVGGTTYVGDGDPADPFIGWWTMSRGVMPAEVWSPIDDDSPTYRWHQYPRTFFLPTLADPNLGEVFSAGQDALANVINPCVRIDTASAPMASSYGPEPDPTTTTVGDWYYNQAVLMHTLKPGWTWTSNPDSAVNRYDLNRVFGTMGRRTNPGFPDPGTPVADTLEYDPTTNPPMGVWTTKAAYYDNNPMLPLTPRAFANAVVLPDATILIVGGQSDFHTGGNDTGIGAPTDYYHTADRFDPQGPGDDGIWTALAEKPDVPMADDPTPRGYHSVAILMKDASVWLMGGQIDFAATSPNSEDTVDHYLPPYLFQLGGSKGRPLLKSVPGTMTYGELFDICVRPGRVSPGSPPISIVKYCLIGLGNVTHHFDYGQRYVELLWHPGGTANCSMFDIKVQLLAPPKPAMAPEGYYLLFAVDSRGVPSKGKLVKLTF